MLSVPVTTRDVNGNEIPDDGEWHRAACDSQYVLAELLVAKGLVIECQWSEHRTW
jgi:hypothetical protein